MTTPLSNIIKEKNQFFDEIQNKLKSGIKKAFEMAPELNAISWDQYTPTFNDGAPCVFCVGTLYFYIDEKVIPLEEQTDDDNEEGISSYSITRNKNISEESKEFFNSFECEFNQLEDILERVFGTNQKIRINRNGNIKIEEYDPGY